MIGARVRVTVRVRVRVRARVRVRVRVGVRVRVRLCMCLDVHAAVAQLGGPLLGRLHQGPAQPQPPRPRLQSVRARVTVTAS